MSWQRLISFIFLEKNSVFEWTVEDKAGPKKFLNAQNPKFKDNEWILPARGEEGGPIQDSGGMVLTNDENGVVLKDKMMYNKQKWIKEGTGDYFRLKNDAGSQYLTAVSIATLAGEFFSKFL